MRDPAFTTHLREPHQCNNIRCRILTGFSRETNVQEEIVRWHDLKDSFVLDCGLTKSMRQSRRSPVESFKEMLSTEQERVNIVDYVTTIYGVSLDKINRPLHSYSAFRPFRAAYHSDIGTHWIPDALSTKFHSGYYSALMRTGSDEQRELITHSNLFNELVAKSIEPEVTMESIVNKEFICGDQIVTGRKMNDASHLGLSVDFLPDKQVFENILLDSAKAGTVANALTNSVTMLDYIRNRFVFLWTPALFYKRFLPGSFLEPVKKFYEFMKSGPSFSNFLISYSSFMIEYLIAQNMDLLSDSFFNRLYSFYLWAPVPAVRDDMNVVKEIPALKMFEINAYVQRKSEASFELTVWNTELDNNKFSDIGFDIALASAVRRQGGPMLSEDLYANIGKLVVSRDVELADRTTPFDVYCASAYPQLLSRIESDKRYRGVTPEEILRAVVLEATSDSTTADFEERNRDLRELIQACNKNIRLYKRSHKLQSL